MVVILVQLLALLGLCFCEDFKLDPVGVRNCLAIADMKQRQMCISNLTIAGLRTPYDSTDAHCEMAHLGQEDCHLAAHMIGHKIAKSSHVELSIVGPAAWAQTSDYFCRPFCRQGCMHGMQEIYFNAYLKKYGFEGLKKDIIAGQICTNIDAANCLHGLGHTLLEYKYDIQETAALCEFLPQQWTYSCYYGLVMQDSWTKIYSMRNKSITDMKDALNHMCDDWGFSPPNYDMCHDITGMSLMITYAQDPEHGRKLCNYLESKSRKSQCKKSADRELKAAKSGNSVGVKDCPSGYERKYWREGCILHQLRHTFCYRYIVYPFTYDIDDDLQAKHDFHNVTSLWPIAFGINASATCLRDLKFGICWDSVRNCQGGRRCAHSEYYNDTFPVAGMCDHDGRTVLCVRKLKGKVVCMELPSNACSVDTTLTKCATHQVFFGRRERGGMCFDVDVQNASKISDWKLYTTYYNQNASVYEESKYEIALPPPPSLHGVDDYPLYDEEDDSIIYSPPNTVFNLPTWFLVLLTTLVTINILLLLAVIRVKRRRAALRKVMQLHDDSIKLTAPEDNDDVFLDQDDDSPPTKGRIGFNSL